MQKSKLQIKIQNSKNLNFGLLLYLLIMGAIFLPFSVFASTVYIDTDHSDFFVGNNIILNVRIDSENKSINAVEGSILLDYLPESASLVRINSSNSEFSLWPNKPLPSADNANISFAGGVPQGLNSKNTVIFNFVLKLQKTGQITVTPNDINVYLNDGKGTKDAVNIKNLTLNVLQQKPDSQSVDDLSVLISNDKTPPEPFEIYLSNADSVFYDQKFLSFTTIDKESGIAYYEVRENNLPPSRSGNTYILKEQNNPVKITVTAYDLAGNARESVYNPASFNYLLYFAPIIFVIILIIIFKKIRKAKNETIKK